MKLAAIATLAAATSFALVAADAPCDAKLTTALMAAATNQAKCKSDSGFDITAATASAEILAKFCKSESCLAMWKTVKDLGLSECMIYDKHLNKEILNPVEAACKGVAVEEDSSEEDSHDMAAMNSTTPATTTKAPSSNSTTPAATTKAPTASNSTSSGNSTTKTPTASNSTSSNSTKTPAPTTKAPTPSTSGASVLSLTASAVILTVATAFF